MLKVLLARHAKKSAADNNSMVIARGIARYKTSYWTLIVASFFASGFVFGT
jgi:hypothetical protein